MTAPLRIALLAHPRHPIAPPFMGGMEAHAWHLAQGLQARGHDVTLIAAGDSRTRTALHPLMDRHYDADLPWHRFHGTARLNAYLDDSHDRALQWIMGQGFDVIHNNGLHRFPPRMARRHRMPMVTSLHVPPFDTLMRAMRDSVAPWHQVTACSRTHLAEYWPDGAPPSCHVVPNGIDMADWPFAPKGQGHAIWAGRITPNKGTHLAIRAARRAGVPLTIFGTIEDRDYFDSHIRSELGGDIRFGGHLSGRDLAVEYGRASVMLFTPQWNEPFGLTALEAMACGTPVAAIRMGAVAEVIGPAGSYAAPDGHDLDLAMLRAMAVPRAAVRDRAARLFGMDAMLDCYDALYRTAIANRNAPAPPVDYAAIELPPLCGDAGRVASGDAAVQDRFVGQARQQFQ